MLKILPILIAVLGTGAGVGAGLFLMPKDASTYAETEVCLPQEKPVEPEIADDTHEKPTTDREYVKLNNQFVIPVMSEDRVVALVVASLSIETSAGQTETVYGREPKLRDSFLQVLFDHANIGGFEGRFTDTARMDILREALLDAAQSVLGKDVSDVLITEIARQDA